MQNLTPTDTLKPLNTRSILDAALDGNAISPAEALHLLQLTRENDLHRLRETADALRKRQVKDTVTYRSGASLYLTNLCELEPALYPYPHKPGDAGAYTLSIDDIDACLERMSARQLQRITLSAGGTWPYLQIPGLEAPNTLKTYAKVLRHIREKAPTLRIEGFSPDEVDFLCVLSDRHERYILEMMQDHGLNTLGGHGVEVLSNPVRQIISPKKASVKRWFEITEVAHRLELTVIAKIEAGPVETLQQRIQHLNALRTFQQMHADEQAKPFALFIPQMWIRPPAKPIQNLPGLAHCTHTDRLKLTAVTRLFLGEAIPDQGVCWVPNADREIQDALQWGASHIGATDALSYPVFLAGSRSLELMSEADLQRLITETGRVPAIRN
ncbi:MAG: synthase subunit 2 [Vampirovibrio sp.]|jgi:FO synthase subunit 2|nr:synthase subunit 2 [Vampirovibrio sp.]